MFKRRNKQLKRPANIPPPPPPPPAWTDPGVQVKDGGFRVTKKAKSG